MKKITALVLTFILLFSLVACTPSNSSEVETTPNQGFLLSPGIVCEFDGGTFCSYSYVDSEFIVF